MNTDNAPKFSVFRWLKSRLLPVTKHDLEEMENRIMSKLSGLAGTLNTLTTEVVVIDAAITKLVAATQDVDLPQDAQDALDTLQASVAKLQNDTPGAQTAPATQSTDDTQNGGAPASGSDQTQ